MESYAGTPQPVANRQSGTPILTTQTHQPQPMEPTKKRVRSCTIINRAQVKEFALQVAHRNYPGRFTRVGSCFLDEFAEEVERLLVAKVKRHPTRGKTLLSSFTRTEPDIS